MPALQTIAGVATIGAGPVFTALTPASGDSLTVKSFPAASSAYLLDAVVGGPAKGQLRVRSSRLHDAVTGIIIGTGEDPSTAAWPRGLLQPLYSSDTLTVELDGTATDVYGAALSIYYSQAGGISARLFDWATVKPLIKNAKPFVTAVTNSGTAGTWTDTVITTTDDQLHADADYAVLGMGCDVAQIAMAVYGQETGNVRSGVPATLTSLATSDYFMRMSAATGLPLIPVFNANNKDSYYVSTIDDTASTTPNVTLYLAELSQTLPGAP